MNTLTCAELLAYPGQTLSEKAESQFVAQRPSDPREPVFPESIAGGFRARPVGVATVRPLSPQEREHGPSCLGRVVDVRRFTGRDRIDRVASYLRAYMPRTVTWAEEDLRAYAARLLQTTQVVE